VAKYGAQTTTDPYQSDCGNGVGADGKNIAGNDPHDTSKEIDEKYVLQWLDHIETVFGTDMNQHVGLLFDNEPGLWSSTHRDVHPKALTYDELWNKTLQYGKAIKARKPTYQTFGPIFWGWCAYMFSPADGCSDGADRQAHDDLPLLEWYVKQVGDYKTSTGVTLVDVIDVHFYPQGTNVCSDAEDSGTAGLRLRSTRSLWDPTYTDESWINQIIELIPRMKGYITDHAPGLRVGLSEYNFGGDNIITGALAQAEALAIFAREDVYAAARWVVPASGTLTESSFAMFLNYDGQGANFYNANSVGASTTDIDVLGSYGFIDSKYIYVVLIFKNPSPGNVTVDISSAITSTVDADVYRFEDGKKLYNAGQVTLTSGKAKISLPGWSATLLRVPQ